MKNERQIAELIFDEFRKTKCKTNQIVPFRSIRFGLLEQLNPKEKSLFDVVFVGLQALGYFTYEDGGLECLRLTEKGYDYIYDDELIEKVVQKPWIIPEFENTNWDRAYTRLWKVIGSQDSATHYFSGPKFYKFILDLSDDTPPSYSDLIEQRRVNNLSTSRVQYYKDLIDQLDDDKRFALYVNIQLSIEDISIQCVSVEDKLDLNMFDTGISHATKPLQDAICETDAMVSTAKIEEDAPIVFISYSWDSFDHEEWVLKLAEDLIDKGVDVILDKWDLGRLGRLLPDFMEQSISKSKRVICVMTPNYKRKTENLEGGVGYEYSIITSTIFGSDLNTSKFIPLIRSGADEDAIPVVLRGRNYIDMRENNEYDAKLVELLRDIHNEPKYKKPTIGKKPKFD